MNPHIDSVHAIIKLIESEETEQITSTPLTCAELSLVLQRVKTQERREIIVQQFKHELTDSNYEDAVRFLSFASERALLLQLLRERDQK